MGVVSLNHSFFQPGYPDMRRGNFRVGYSTGFNKYHGSNRILTGSRGAASPSFFRRLYRFSYLDTNGGAFELCAVRTGG